MSDDRLDKAIGEFVATSERLAKRCTQLEADLAAARGRIDELLATIVKLTNETPYDDEIRGALEQRGKLIAEIGTLKARVHELEAERTGIEGERDGYRETALGWQQRALAAEAAFDRIEAETIEKIASALECPLSDARVHDIATWIHRRGWR